MLFGLFRPLVMSARQFNVVVLLSATRPSPGSGPATHGTECLADCAHATAYPRFAHSSMAQCLCLESLRMSNLSVFKFNHPFLFPPNVRLLNVPSVAEGPVPSR